LKKKWGFILDRGKVKRNFAYLLQEGMKRPVDIKSEEAGEGEVGKQRFQLAIENKNLTLAGFKKVNRGEVSRQTKEARLNPLLNDKRNMARRGNYSPN